MKIINLVNTIILYFLFVLISSIVSKNSINIYEEIGRYMIDKERNILNTYREREKGPDSWFTEIFLYINSLKIILLDL